MPSIYLFRHGQDDEAYRGGWRQRGLVDEGFRQTSALAAYLRRERDRFPFAVLVSSDLRRAAETARAIADTLGIPLELSSAWRETNNGMLAGMSNREAQERYPGLYWRSLAMDERYPGGESPREHFRRIQRAFHYLSSAVIANRMPSHVGVVTHGGVINIIYHIVQKIEWSNRAPAVPVGMTSMHRLDYVDGRWIVAVANLQEHLDQGRRTPAERDEP